MTTTMTTSVTTKPTIGWIGCGVMGKSMCKNLIDKGHPVRVYSRTAAKCEPLVNAGAVLCNSPADIARESTIIFTMVGIVSEVEEVYFGKQGLLSEISAGSILIDMTTSKPELAEKIYSACCERNCSALDAPVSGGIDGARDGILSIMVGGDEETFQRALPMLQILGKTIQYMGHAGMGHQTKITNQIIIASQVVGICEGLVYAAKAQLDLDKVLQCVSKGAGRCYQLDKVAPLMLDRNFEPRFFLKLWVKDLEIALDEARRMHLCLPGLALAHQLYLSLRARGLDNLGHHALIMALEDLNSVKVCRKTN